MNPFPERVYIEIGPNGCDKDPGVYVPGEYAEADYYAAGGMFVEYVRAGVVRVTKPKMEPSSSTIEEAQQEVERSGRFEKKEQP